MLGKGGASWEGGKETSWGVDNSLYLEKYVVTQVYAFVRTNQMICLRFERIIIYKFYLKMQEKKEL